VEKAPELIETKIVGIGKIWPRPPGASGTSRLLRNPMTARRIGVARSREATPPGITPAASR
jgi:hypothetical protein